MADSRARSAERPETAEIHILSSENECKEVLVLMLRGNAVSAGNIPITAVELSSGDNAAEFHFTLREENEAAADLAAPSEITGYLLEPSPAILKSGAFKLPAVRFGLRKISASTHFYTAPAPVEHFPGKIRRIIEVLPFHKAAIRDFRKKYPACSVTARNFPITSEELRRRLGTAESDTLRVLATTASDGTRLLIVSTPSI